MPNDMIQQLQAAQMMLIAALEFVALYASLAVCAGLLVWFVGIVTLGYCEMRGRRRAAIASRNASQPAHQVTAA